ncbi:crossover junction endonuclease MUS81 [Aspergillus chevalieri]|uniref:Crossover junction endonuclease MUS81 n=1 Tax=Aspergillus chevalieri TaxID=182096 RepID=A0A7R7ZL58_ASPCH|nr:crossover junction endonuclease Mus81 [Aspergillus chevalieri]BCR84797.1 crossover junction endonuclease Mus81 [Aspergillus chevalieri]
MSEETCANPLLLGWIKEWLDQARERNSKGFTVYKKAYESMKACPLVFQHPSEAQQLNGLGPKLCDRLTDKLKEYCAQNGLPEPEPPHKKSKRPSGEGLPEDQPAKKLRKKKAYVPALRSGPYALLLGLGTLNENASQSMTKAQLIEAAQPYCDSSFTVPPDPTKFYTAWNSMKTLVQKDLVYEHGRPLRKYALTEEGWEVAKRVQKTLPGTGQSTLPFGGTDEQASANPRLQRTPSIFTDNDNDIQASTSQRPGAVPETLDEDQEDLNPYTLGTGAADGSNITPIPLAPKSFTIQLILDTREVRSSKDRDYISNELTKRGVTPEVRALELGDAMWVARVHDQSILSRHGEENANDEIMLDWIVERKRLDDLVGSIKDGRFHEQKFRLRRSGIRNVIYLIEEFTVTQDSAMASKYHEMVASAIATTQVVNGYFVKKTRNLDDTIRYLTRMTFLLQKMYDDSTNTLSFLPTSQISSSQAYLSALERLRPQSPAMTYGVTFSTFSALSSKSDVLALRDVFLKMLMCIRGVTGDKALEIQRRWRTPRELVEAFQALDPRDREDMVAERMKGMVGRKKIMKALSKKIAEVWGS